MSRLKKVNDGTTFILTVIYVFSKIAWCVPLKTQVSSLVGGSLYTVAKQRGTEHIANWQGHRILNRPLQKLPLQKLQKEHGVNHFATHNEATKASIVERFNRTLKTRTWRYFTKTQSVRYVDVLQAFMRSYNDTYHRSIGMAPSEVTSTNQETVWQRLYAHESVGTPNSRVGDRVRISKAKQHFEKGYMANWTEELFTIVDAHWADPPVYHLVDWHGDKLDGTFYEPDLQKVVVPKGKTYRVEPVLRWRNKRREDLVKWSGYPTSFNSWIDVNTLVNY